MALIFSQGYMRGQGDPNLDLQIQSGGNAIPKLYIDDLTDSVYQFDNSFDVGFKWVLLFSGFVTKVTDIKVLLQGPISGSIMTKTLSTLNLLPLSEPYSNLGYIRVGFDNESVSDLSVFTTNNITDWILVELRDKINPEIVRYNKAGLLRNDGVIMDVDGVTKLTFNNIRNEFYYIAIKHRNHLGLMTKQPIDISNTIDFTSNLTTVFGLENRKDNSGILRLRVGKIYTQGYLIHNGINGFYSEIYKRLNYLLAANISNIYDVFDTNLDGSVRMSGFNNDRVTALNSVDVNPDLLFIEQIPPILNPAITELSVNRSGQKVQVGNTAERLFEKGIFRLNEDFNKLEFYNGAQWEQVNSTII